MPAFSPPSSRSSHFPARSGLVHVSNVIARLLATYGIDIDEFAGAEREFAGADKDLAYADAALADAALADAALAKAGLAEAALAEADEAPTLAGSRSEHAAYAPQITQPVPGELAPFGEVTQQTFPWFATAEISA